MFHPPAEVPVRVTSTLFVESDVDTVNVSSPVPEVLTSHVVLSRIDGQTNFVIFAFGSAAMTTFVLLLDEPMGTVKW